ncbi:MAG: hypothetical protein IPK16_08380 [Anaerolineales bacterium]|nr:hypothetical protein [Anaerolineales bacterium]
MRSPVWGRVLLLLSVAILAIVLAAPAVWAAVELNYFTVVSYPTSVVLEWSTAAEANLAGFDIQCKLAEEPDTAYHSIGFVQAKGGPQTGALYSFPVTAVTPGVSYCFQLKEMTTDGTPGEAFTRCGYGPNVTPTPGAPGIVTTNTPVPPMPVGGTPVTLDPNGNPILPTIAPLPIATDEFGNPIVAPTQLPAPIATDQYGNPVVTPTPVDQQFQPDPNQQLSPLASPTVDPALWTPTATLPAQAYESFPTALPAQPMVDVPTLIPPPLAAVGDGAGNGVANLPADGFNSPLDPAIPPPLDPAGQALAADIATPAPPAEYLLVTATPTTAAVALAPQLTPLPTVTPTPSGLMLASALQPNAQNLMAMLLCMTFTGASAIGILGLITSIMYMRSRTSQREFYDRYSDRRR